jgi:hypothetical protein
MGAMKMRVAGWAIAVLVGAASLSGGCSRPRHIDYSVPLRFEVKVTSSGEPQPGVAIYLRRISGKERPEESADHGDQLGLTDSEGMLNRRYMLLWGHAPGTSVPSGPGLALSLVRAGCRDTSVPFEWQSLPQEDGYHVLRLATALCEESEQ